MMPLNMLPTKREHRSQPQRKWGLLHRYQRPCCSKWIKLIILLQAILVLADYNFRHAGKKNILCFLRIWLDPSRQMFNYDNVSLGK